MVSPDAFISGRRWLVQGIEYIRGQPVTAHVMVVAISPYLTALNTARRLQLSGWRSVGIVEIT